MAQSALTVTTPNPTPPTNLSSIGATPPTDPAQAFADDGIAMPTPNSGSLAAANGATANEPSGTGTTFAAKTAAAGAGTSVDNEGKGTETVVTATVPNPSPAGQLKTVSVLGNYTNLVSSPPNQQHASSLTPLTNPALASIAPPSVASGAGTQLLTCTGTNFTRQSVIWVNGVAQATTFVSPTTITATVTKKATAGTWPVVVVTGGVITTAPQTWTFT
jgi:hypothetical protein